MMEELSFEEPVDLIGTLLPYNYLPAAFGILSDVPDQMNRIVLVIPGEDDARRRLVQYHVVSQDTLRDSHNVEGKSNRLASYLTERGIADDFAYRRCFLGPPTRLEETSANEARSLAFEPFEIANAEAIEQVAVIIDIGIAFWNKAFRSATGPRFKAMRYLDFDAGPGTDPLQALTAAEIYAICTQSDQPGGQDRVAADLGARFPGSYFGPDGAAVPGTLWHGTAMADLMAGLPPDVPDTTALMGIELPMAVLRDADGDNLGAVLATLVEGALEMTTAFAGVPLVIALPWGFCAGPQNGTHPFAKAIDKVLALHAGRDIKLLVAMGNQMQDRCSAHLLPSDPAEPENAVIWRLPPDDFSDNSLEFVVIANSAVLRQTVRITTPTGNTVVILLRESRRALIRRDGVIIGMLVRYKDTPGGPRLRLTFGPTGWRPNTAKPTPAGDWVVSFHHGDEVLIWVLRDDRDAILDKALPRRASHLHDPNYQARDQHDAYRMTDDPNSAVVRSGTASLLASAGSVIAVQADVTLGGGGAQPAWYSGRRTSGAPAAASATVDPGRHNAGVLAAANGSAQMTRVSGTSAAVALVARGMLNLPARPS